MANDGRILIYFDELVMSLTKAYRQTMDTHIYSPRDILSSIQGIKPVDAVEVVHGRWEPNPHAYGFERCSVCNDCNIWGEWADGKKWNYCPNCGAKMDGDGNG